jgi:DNA polymerase I-like protein with 3'-5' exonuclease and polymerase domains
MIETRLVETATRFFWEEDAAAATKPKKRKKPQLFVAAPDGLRVDLMVIPKHFRDALELHHKPAIRVDDYGNRYWILDIKNPLLHWSFNNGTPTSSFEPIKPSRESAICKRCELYTSCKTPFQEPIGPTDPMVTVIYEFVSGAEDDRGQLGGGGLTRKLRELYASLGAKIKFPFEQIRWMPLVRCANRMVTNEKGKLEKRVVNYKTKANWCGIFAVQDLMLHPPKLVMPVGSVCLGYLSFKSNAQDWGGQMLTYRGWPDDWLMEVKYSRPVDGEIKGHPLFGQRVGPKMPMIPIQSPGIVEATQNPRTVKAWCMSILSALTKVSEGIQPKQYVLPHYLITTDPKVITSTLQELIDSPGTLVAFDTETTGLKAFAEGAQIVYIMFRWEDASGPRSIGFPWAFAESPVNVFIPEITPYLVKALCASQLIGHNLSFDALFSIANIDKCDIDKLADACVYDTWHEAFILRQAKGTLSLDMMAYKHVPELGGYDEDFTILIELYRELLHPENGGHYALCPPEYQETHLKPYVMGDVEVAYKTHGVLRDLLAKSKSYKIPLAHPTKRGRFRWYQTMGRAEVYDKIVSPASRVLIKMMARGLKIDEKELGFQEEMFPQLIFEARKKLREVTPEVLEWCEYNEAQSPGWFLDLESKDHLREILFKKMKLPVKALTASGLKKYAESDKIDNYLGDIDRVANHVRKLSKDDNDFNEKWDEYIKYIAIDKFTLTALSATHPRVRPLLEYRSIFKQYASYIRPIRNITTTGIDKKARTQAKHLARDGLVHTRFMITGTRSGRLSCVDGETPLEVHRDGRAELIEIQHLDVDQTLHIKTHMSRWRRIVKKFFKGYDEMFKVTTSLGNSIVCTKKHEFISEYGWTQLNDLSVGTVIRMDADFNAQQKSSDTIVAIESVGTRGVWDIEVEDDHSYVACGFINHNSSEPNLQQLPSRGQVKRIYVSRFGDKGCLYQGDLSQIELRLIAAACGDESMVNAYVEGIDLHSLTMSKIFKMPYDHCIKDHVSNLQKAGKDKEAKECELKRKISKCVDPDTLVSVNGRIIRVCDIHPGREDDTFYPIAGNIHGPVGPVPLKHFYSNGVKKRLLICSKRGMLACSEEHPILMADGSLKKAKDIRKKDVLAEPVRMPCENEWPTIPFNPIGLSPSSSIFNIHVNKDLAYLLGLFYGDGECQTHIGICFGGSEEFFPWQDVVVESIQRCGFETILDRTVWDSKVDGAKVAKSGPSKGVEVHGSSGHVTFGSTRVQDIFIQLGAIKLTDETALGRQRSLRLPTWLFNARRKLKISFLAGWFDTDGSIRQGSLSGITKSWVFAQDICVLLSSLGIQFSLSPGLNKTHNRFYYRITISLGDTWEFFNGELRHPDKKSRIRPPLGLRVAKPNLCTEVIELPPGHVVDVEVDTPEHLFVANNLVQRNTVNFLTGYGGGAQGLQATLAQDGIYKTIEECEAFLEAFFDSYPALREYLTFYKGFIADNGVAVSMLGRVRLFEEVTSEDQGLKNKALRAGCNHLIQATASDMMLICICAIETLMREAGLKSVLVSTVHDSLLVDSLREELPVIHEIAMGVFKNIPDILDAWLGDQVDLSWTRVVPYDGDCEVGKNYLDMVKLSHENNDWADVCRRMDKE